MKQNNHQEYLCGEYKEESFEVEINVVEDGTLVLMEIEVPDRFKVKSKDSQER